MNRFARKIGPVLAAVAWHVGMTSAAWAQPVPEQCLDDSSEAPWRCPLQEERLDEIEAVEEDPNRELDSEGNPIDSRGNPIRVSFYKHRTFPVEYTINTRSFLDAGFPDEDFVRSLVDDAFAKWTSVAGTSAAVARGPDMTIASTCTTYDGINEIKWIENDWADCLANSGGPGGPAGVPANLVLGITKTITAPASVLWEAEILLNGETLNPATDTAKIREVMIHEAGHFFGLGHNSDVTSAEYEPPLMMRALIPENGPFLSDIKEGDRIGIREIYPAEENLCESDYECPQGDVCTVQRELLNIPEGSFCPRSQLCVPDENGIAMCQEVRRSLTGQACVNIDTANSAVPSCGAKLECVGLGVRGQCTKVVRGSRRL